MILALHSLHTSFCFQVCTANRLASTTTPTKRIIHSVLTCRGCQTKKSDFRASWLPSFSRQFNWYWFVL